MPPARTPDDGGLTARPATYTRCTSCGSLMLWVLTIEGRRWPLDPQPHPDGTVVVTHLPDGTVRGRVLSGAELPAQQEAHRLHDRVCPARPRPAEGPRCGACREVMDGWLVDRGYTRHIGCMTPPPAPRPAPAATVEAPAAPVGEQGELFDLGGGA